MSWVTPTELKVEDPFRSLFPIQPAILEAIKESMKVSGFDVSKPINVWAGRGIVVDGHTRLRAAMEASILKVAIYEHDFIAEEAALAYAIGNQQRRRNLTDMEIARCLEALDRRKERGGDHGNQYTGGKVAKAQPCANSDSEQPGEKVAAGKSSIETAKLLGISPRKVEQARTVLDHADEETKEAILTGEKSINKAYQETQEKRRGGEPKREKKDSQPKMPMKEGYLECGIGFIKDALGQIADEDGPGAVDEAIKRVADTLKAWWREEKKAREEESEEGDIDLSREEVLARIEELRAELSGANKGPKLVAAIVRRLNEERIPTLNGIEKWNMGQFYAFMKVVEEKA